MLLITNSDSFGSNLFVSHVVYQHVTSAHGLVNGCIQDHNYLIMLEKQ